MELGRSTSIERRMAGLFATEPIVSASLLQRVSPLYSTFQPYICSATEPANSRVRSAAGISLHPLAFWPDQRGEKSLLPWLSAIARRGAIAEVARGNAGAAAPGYRILKHYMQFRGLRQI